MSKRRAHDPLEDSPASKRSRLGEATPTPDFELPPPSRATAITAATQHDEDGQEGRQAEDEEEEDGGDDPGRAPYRRRQPAAPADGYDDLYLDTVNRHVLDFDFEKLCSVSLSNINVYACLVCGRYYQGRGPSSHAYFHALDEDHHVFINLETQRVYVLPEGYEVRSRALDDIKYVADPRYTRDEVARLDRARAADRPPLGRTLAGAVYAPGFVGLNNIKENDYVNVVVQALARVGPLRDFFLIRDHPQSGPPQSELVRRCGALVRKMWNPRAFRAHVSPHELLQEIALLSGRRFTLTTQSDPVDFLSWFLNHLHLGLGGSRSRSRPGSSVVQRAFQGQLRVESQAVTVMSAGEDADRVRFEDAAEIRAETARFMLLTLDLPPPPLFRDELERNIIPHVALAAILAKYDGRRAQEDRAQRRRYRLLHPLPPYLIMHIRRFSKNKFVAERNPTIVTFDPREGLDVSPYVDPASAHDGMADDNEGGGRGGAIMYDLVANVVHEAIRTGDVDGVADSGEERKTWKAQVRDRATGEWVVCQDLFVDKIQPELLYLGETYLQIWERRRRGRGGGSWST